MLKGDFMSKFTTINKKLKFIGLLTAALLLTACANTSGTRSSEYNYGDYGVSNTDFYYVGSGYNPWDRGKSGWYSGARGGAGIRR